VKVALVIERFEPGAGGVERVAQGLAAAGDEVHVVARRTAPAPASSPGPGIRVHRAPAPAFWQPLRVLAFSRAAARHTATLGCDVVHSFSRTRHQDVYRAGGGSHADYLERRHGATRARVARLSPRHAVLLGIERAVFASPHQLVQCNSEMVRDEIARRYGVPDERLVVIPNGVDLERFHPRRRASEGARLRVDMHVSPGAVWLFAGSGWRRKGLDTALRAMATASDRTAELWVAGRDAPGPWRRLADRVGVGGRVRFLGPRSDLEAVCAAADLLLLPTRYDAFANVCLEAAAAGLPVVTSAANGAARALGEGAAVVDDPEDADAFAARLDALGDPERREPQGRAARKVAQGFGWDAHVAALRALYARVRAGG